MSSVQKPLSDAAVERLTLDSLNDADRTDAAADDLDRVLVCESGARWHRWDGKRWVAVPAAVARDEVKQWHQAYAASHIRTLPPKDLVRFLSAGAIEATLKLLAGKLARDPAEFDAHPDLLNVGNGVVDLRTGELMPHDPALLLTKFTAVNYEPDASHKDWETALKALPKSSREWMHLRFGQASTGHTPDDDVLAVLKGGGANGKSTILAAIAGALGEYAMVVPDRLLLSNPGDHPTELTTLRGARLAYLEETPEEGRLNVKRLKDVIGTPYITARQMRQDNITWRASHSLLLSTNHSLRVAETDHGTWRRLALVEFPYRYVTDHEPDESKSERRGDRNLRSRLMRGDKGRAEAVLAWVVSGARDWYDNDSQIPAPPKRIVEATKAWRGTADLVARFADECLVLAPDEFTPAASLYAVFSEWLAANGSPRWSAQTFNARLEGHDVLAQGVVRKLHRVDGVPTKGWLGLAITGKARDEIAFAELAARGLRAPHVPPYVVSIDD